MAGSLEFNSSSPIYSFLSDIITYFWQNFNIINNTTLRIHYSARNFGFVSVKKINRYETYIRKSGIYIYHKNHKKRSAI